MVWSKYSTTPASNNASPPAGAPEGMNPSDVNDTMRDMMAEIRTLGDYTSGAWTDIASASTVNIGAAAQAHLRVTGTTGITAFDSVTSGIWRRLRFAGALTWTHNGTSMILPGAANITTAAGDTADVVSLASGNWICTQYTTAAGSPVISLPLASTAWTPGFTGFSANPTVVATYQKVGKRCFIDILNSASGTSNSTAFTITGLPFTSAGTSQVGVCYAVDGGNPFLSTYYVASGSTTIVMTKGAAASPTAGNNWTNTSSKGANLSFNYETV